MIPVKTINLNNMETTKYLVLGLFVMIMASTSCTREINNPYDPECPAEIWTPRNFKVIQPTNKNAVELSWSQDILHIDGFRIDRKVGGLAWANVITLGKNDINWTDTQISPLVLHQYRLYAIAGNNQSNSVTGEITPVFTGVIIDKAGR
jgi:hypothetical protein